MTENNLRFKVETAAYLVKRECYSDSKFMVEKQMLKAW